MGVSDCHPCRRSDRTGKKTVTLQQHTQKALLQLLLRACNTDHRRHLVLLKVRYATPLVVAIHLAVAVLKPAAGLSVRFAFFSLGFGPSQTHCTEGCDAAGVQTAGPVQAGLRAPMNECVMESRRDHLQRRRGCLPRVRALRERSVPPRPTGRTRDLQSGCREHARNARNAANSIPPWRTSGP